MSLAERVKVKNAFPKPVPTPFWPEWDGKLYVRKLSAKASRETSQYAIAEDKAGTAQEPSTQFWHRILIACLCLEDRQPFILPEEEAEAPAFFDGVDWDAIRPVVNEALDFNGLSAKAAEQAEKNSETTLSGDSPSSSAAPSESSIPTSS